MALVHQLGSDPAGYPPTVHTGPDSTSPAGGLRGGRVGPGPMFRLGTDSR